MKKINPSTPKNSSKPVEYHCYDSCNKCRGANDVTTVDTTNYQISECRTKCKDCGFEDYWAYGFFESSQDMESKCQTYSFGRQ